MVILLLLEIHLLCPWPSLLFPHSNILNKSHRTINTTLSRPIHLFHNKCYIRLKFQNFLEQDHIHLPLLLLDLARALQFYQRPLLRQSLLLTNNRSNSKDSLLIRHHLSQDQQESQQEGGEQQSQSQNQNYLLEFLQVVEPSDEQASPQAHKEFRNLLLRNNHGNEENFGLMKKWKEPFEWSKLKKNLHVQRRSLVVFHVPLCGTGSTLWELLGIKRKENQKLKEHLIFESQIHQTKKNK
mmetsp:Transcript_5461/g.7051  ORF Transcript_5461/g.7051 Transcript_5461/m.7051 type:complete len:240 (+) Transcript_5461:634-1353(+)